ncbi:MAG TPA: hypothetical protein VJC03_00660 [bacterium]|nr:hypothetical protein [bacterium]
MKCPFCDKENKKDALQCKNCGEDLIPSGIFSWRSHFRVFAVILLFLTGLFFFYLSMEQTFYAWIDKYMR